MTEKRYFSVDYDEEYYIFDSTKISEEEVLEKAEYSYDVFGESLTPQEHLDLLNENEQLRHDATVLIQANTDYRKENEQLRKKVVDIEYDSEKEIEREQHRRELIKENEELKQENSDLKKWLSTVPQMENRIKELKERNNRQAERLDELYSLIEKGDWKGLAAIIDELNEAEELNQMEFKACGDR